MTSKIKFSLLFLIIGFVCGLMVGLSMDPLDRAIRKAQKINRTNLRHIKSFRDRKALKSAVPDAEKHSVIQENRLKRLESKMDTKNQSVQILEDIKEFVDLATQEVFIDNSLHRYLLSLGRIQLQNGMFFESLKTLERAYQLNPSHPSTPNLLSKNYLRLYQILPKGEEKNRAAQKAIHFFTIQIDNNVQDIEAMQGLGMIYSAIGEYNKAIPLFEHVLRKNPEDIESNLGLAGIYLKTNKIKEAKQMYQDVEALILETKRKGRLFRHPTMTRSQLDRNLSITQHNLEIIEKTKRR